MRGEEAPGGPPLYVPLTKIEQQVSEEACQLVATSHFHDFVPLLVQKAVRARLHNLG